MRVANDGATDVGICEGTSFAEQMSAYGTAPLLLLEIDFPSGRQYFSGDAMRFADYLYKGQLLSAGQFRRSIQQNLGLYEISSIEARLADVARQLIRLAESDRIKGVVARFKIGSRKLPLDSFVTLAEGKIDDFGAEEYAFRLIVKDRLWTMPLKPDTGFVTLDEFANALPADVGKPLPICYGTHSDTGTDDAKNRGAWPTLFVDVRSTERTFLIATHSVKAINEVYAFKSTAGSQLLVETTDYVAYKNGFIGTRRCAFIKLTTTGFNKLVDTNALGVLTVNVNGKEDIGDGTGILIDNPVDILRDLMGNYLGSPILNGATFDKAHTVAITRSYVAAGGYIDEQTTDEFLRDICDSFQIRIFPDLMGRIAINIFDPPGPGAGLSDIREQWEILSNTWNLDFQSDIQGAEDLQIVNSADYEYSFHWAKKHFRGSNNVTDTISVTKYGTKRLKLSLKWARAQNTGLDIANRIVVLYRNPVPHASFTMPLTGMNVELADPVAITHIDGPPSGGYAARTFELIEHTFNPQDFSVGIRAKDIGPIAQGGYFFDDEIRRQRVANGSVAVANASADINATGATSFITAGVVVGDIIRLKTVANEANRKDLKITAVTDLDTVQTAQTVWTNESGIGYEIIRSWLTKATGQEKYGHLCDVATGQFSNADTGFKLL